MNIFMDFGPTAPERSAQNIFCSYCFLSVRVQGMVPALKLTH